MVVEQIPLHEWPVGLTVDVAQVRQRATDLHAVGVRFSRSVDNLDYFRGAILKLTDGSVVALRDYERSPNPGAIIVFHWDAEDFDSQLERVLGLLGLDHDDVTWRVPNFAEAARSCRQGHGI